MKTLDADKFLSQFKDEGGTVTMSKMHEAIKAATVELEIEEFRESFLSIKAKPRAAEVPK